MDKMFPEWLLLTALLLLGGTSIDMVKASPELHLVSVEPSQFAPETKIENNELFLITNITRVELSCEAHFPVQWDYSGQANPRQLYIQTVRRSGNKLVNLLYSSTLFINRVSSSLTGTYNCRSVLNPSKSVGVHIFAQEKGYRGPDPVLLKYGKTIDITLFGNETDVLLPCTSWDPRVQMKLFKKSEKDGKYKIVEESKDEKSYWYDAKSGFHLNLTSGVNLDEDEETLTSSLPSSSGGRMWWGEYMCSPAIEKTYDRVYVKLFRKPEFRVTPDTSVVEALQGESVQLRCESRSDDISISVGGGINDARVLTTKETIANAFYGVIVAIDYSNLAPDDAAEVHCVNRDTGKVLHTWKIHVIQDYDLKLRGFVKYHSRRTNLDWFACRSATSRPPTLTFVQCANDNECQIRGQCLTNGNVCDSATIQLCSGGCTHASIENRSGILQCKGDGVFQQIHQFFTPSGTYVYNSILESKEDTLTLDGKQAYKLNSIGEYSCKGSTFLYAGGMRWGLRSQNGTLKVLDESSEELESFQEEFVNDSSVVIAKAVLRLDSPHLNEVTCFAPFWNTTDWESTSLPLYLQS